VTYLLDTRKPDPTLNDLRVHLFPAVLVQSCLITSDFALIHIPQEGHHLGVKHRREEIRVEGGVPKAFFKAMASCISPGAVDLRQTKFVFRWDIVKEPVVKCFV